jgi:hypothetical protein
LKKNADPARGPQPGIDYKFEYFSEFEFIFKTILGYEPGGWGTCINEKTKAKFLVSVPFKSLTHSQA